MKYGWNKESKKIFNKMKEFFDNKCVRCNGESGLLNVERDHIIPSYQGGSNEPSNWQPLCAKCNSSKGPENIDFRLLFCEKNNKKIPKNLLP